MRYAINNWIYGDEPLRETFSRLARFKYDGIELVGEPDRINKDEVNQLAHEFGIPVTSVLGWSIWGIPGRDLASPNDDEREGALQYGRDCIDFAVAIGAPVFIVIPAAAGRTTLTGNPRTEAAWQSAFQAEWDIAVESVRQTASYAAERNVVLALEPINRYETFLVTNLAEALTFIDQVGADNLKLNLDTFHMNIEEPDLGDAVRSAGDLLVNVHVSDSNRQAPGRGHTDFAALIQALAEVGFTGAFVFEPVPPGSDPILMSQFSKNLSLRDTFAEESISYLKSLEARF